MRYIRFYSTILSALLLFAAGMPARAEGAAPLSFAEDGTFTVMLVSDVEELPAPSGYYTSVLSRALDGCKPNLVVFLGDQLFGGSGAFSAGSRAENVRNAIEGVVKPAKDRGVPFAVVLGSADADAGVPADLQLSIYESAGAVGEASGEQGVRRLGVRAYGGTADILNFYFFDTAGRTADGGEGAVSAEQIESYRGMSAKLREGNGGEVVPSIAFSHGFVPEIYEALDEAGMLSEAAVEGGGAYEGRYYLKESEAVLFGGVNTAPTVSAENFGLFDALADAGDVFAACFGGDHANAFLTAFDGVDLVGVPGATYVGENSRGTRGAMLLRFSEDNVRDYEIRFVPFADYENLNVFTAIPYYLAVDKSIPTNAKIAFFAGVILLAAALLLLADGRKKGGIPAPYDDGKEDIPLETAPKPNADKKESDAEKENIN